MKMLKITAVVAFTAGIGWFIFGSTNDRNSDNENSTDYGDFSSGEYSIMPGVHYENLDVFLIQNSPEIDDKTYVPLAEALENKMITVEETGTVNELVVHNNSDEYVFIHSGDIVKGGKQDRTLAFDVILPPHTQNIALQSFCVESGRWTNRGSEDVSQFNASTKMLSSKDLRTAAIYEKDQSTVWSNVNKEQQKLNDNVSKLNGYNVELQDAVSETSLQLTLENEELEKAKETMNNIFQDLAKEHEQTTGFVYAINGEIYGADIYNNRDLFVSVWNRLMESVITESIANLQDTLYAPASEKQVLTFLNAIEESPDSTLQERTEEINDFTHVNITENDSGAVVFSTIDLEIDQWLHRSFFRIEPREEIKSLPFNYDQMQQIQNDIHR